MLRREIEEQVPTTYEYVIITKSGERRWLEVNTRLTFENGTPAGAQCIGRDITERRQAEESLRESELKLRSVTQSANDAIIAADSKGNIISWNNGANGIFGYDEAEVLGIPLTIFNAGNLPGGSPRRNGATRRHRRKLTSSVKQSNCTA